MEAAVTKQTKTKLPDGTLVSNSPYDGGGDSRAKLYSKMGFSERYKVGTGTTESQFAVVYKGKLVPVTLDEAISRNKANVDYDPEYSIETM